MQEPSGSPLITSLGLKLGVKCLANKLLYALAYFFPLIKHPA
jgi:hypothetical protein